MEEIKKFYTLQEIAKMLKVTERTLYTHIKNGKLKAAKIGRHWRISEDALKDYLEGK